MSFRRATHHRCPGRRPLRIKSVRISIIKGPVCPRSKPRAGRAWATRPDRRQSIVGPAGSHLPRDQRMAHCSMACARRPSIRWTLGEIDRRRTRHGQHGRIGRPLQPARCGNLRHELGDGQCSDQSRRQRPQPGSGPATSLGRRSPPAFNRNRNRPVGSGFCFTQPVDMSFHRCALLWIAACQSPLNQ